MSELFLNVVNRSIAASWLVLAVLVLRMLLKRAPKWGNVLLWGMVALRLLCPISIESAFSLIPSAETIHPEIMMDHYPQLSTGISELNDALNPVFAETFAPNPGDSANPLQILVPAAAVIWLLGGAIMLGYTLVTYWHLRRRVSTATILRDNIFQSEYVASPFVLGILRPRIYLPYAIGEKELSHVIAHEQAHIRRRDHWWKPLGFLLLALHWFNPLMWAAYVLLCRDIELACDEKVIKELACAQRADYSEALLACSVKRSMIAACPLAFGEVGVKARVRSVMHYQKPGFWLILLAVILSAAVAVCFLTNPREARNVGITYYYGTVTDRAMGTSAYLRLRCADGEEMLFQVAQSVPSEPDLLGAQVMLRARVEASTGLMTATKVTVTDHTWAGSKEEAMERAILDFNWTPRYERMFQCADFVVLSEAKQGGTEIYYGIALHQVFTVEDGVLEEQGGSHVPTVLTFAIDDAGRYLLREYWEPRDGSKNAADIREKFPAFLWPDTQEHIQRQIQNNYVRAVEHFQLDTDAVIEGLLAGEDELSHRELLYYGPYTLGYCCSQFEKGGQTDLRGQAMSLVCKEILEIWGESGPGETLQGQAWYDAYADHAASLHAQTDPEEIAAKHPGVVVYLQKKGIPLYDWGITLSVRNVTPHGLTIRCTQSGGSFQSKLRPGLDGIHLLSGSHYWLEKNVDGAWVSLPVLQDTAWTTEGWPVPLRETIEWDTRWDGIYGSLEPGQYRIGKVITLSPTLGSSISQRYYAVFEIE